MTLKLPPAVNYYRVPNSNAQVEIEYARDGKLVAIVRCAAGGHRLFDVHESQMFIGWHPEIDYPMYDDCYKAIRACPRCKATNELDLTAHRGTPVGEDGPWKCAHCGAHLGQINAPRGRLTVPCPKCRGKFKDVRVTAMDAYVATKAARDRLERAASERARVQAAAPKFDDSFDDVPF